MQVGRTGEASSGGQHGNGDERRSPGDVIVDRGRHPGVLRRGGGQHGGGQRRYVDGQAQAEDQDSRQNLSDVVSVEIDAGEQRQADGDHDRANAHLQSWPDPGGQTTRARR